MMEPSNIARGQRQAYSIQFLESQHEVNLASEEIIHKEEDSRRLRVSLLAQKEANNDLQDCLAIKEDRIHELEEIKSDLQAQLEQVEGAACQIEADLRAKEREINTLKTELTSMNGLSKDSNRLLAEKLELSKEIASIKPELDHLRSQASFQQKVLSEKLSLQRQLSTVELELEVAKTAVLKEEIAKGTISTKEAEFKKQVEDLKRELAQEREKREQIQHEAAQEIESIKEEASKQAGKLSTSKKEARLQTQLNELRKELTQEMQEREQAQKAVERELAAARKEGSKQALKDAELKKQLEDLRSEAAREKKEREQVQTAAERDAQEWESKRTILEGKVEAMRKKLLATKEELKEVQASLAQTIAQASKPSVTIDLSEPQNMPRKRSALSILDNTIGTPDGIAVRGKRAGQKRGKLDHISFGEKSMFSITPYLQKTTNALLEPLQPDEERVADAEEDMQLSAQDDEKHALLAAEGTEADASPSVSRVRSETKMAKKPAAKKPKAPFQQSVATAKKSAQVTPEQVEEEPKADEPPASSEAKFAIATASRKQLLNVPKFTAEVAEAKKKKRKILGSANKTIFDEEDAEATKRPAKIFLATNKPLARLAGKKNLSSGPAAQFGAFSPLKKDKRGVQASFLG